MPFSMPLRSLNTFVLKWPDLSTVHVAVRDWVSRASKHHPELIRVGYYGSYARGDWGVGSDVDLICIVETADKPFEARPLDWDLTGLPVPADLLVYTMREWRKLKNEGGRFFKTIEREAVWVYPDTAPGKS